MKKAALAIAIVAVAAFTTLTVSSKSTTTDKQAEIVKVDKSDFVKKSFAAPKSDLSSID